MRALILALVSGIHLILASHMKSSLLPTAEKLIDNRCTSKKTCGDCISLDPSCAWCKQEVFGHSLPRCDHRDNLIKRNCSSDNILSPESKFSIAKDEPLSDAGVKKKSYVQIKPQRIRLKLRPHDPVTIPVMFRQAEDYPLDLYYLMDLTYSMRDDKEKLHEMGDSLVDIMSNISSNFRVGFGSFVDKVVLPYANTVPAKLKNPCLDGKVCVPPYGYRNHMSLSNDTKHFVDEVSVAQVSANLDDAEGGFDAIMQVLVCKNQIDWDERSRKIVLFATDSGFHYAGDGKLGGIVIPNDEKCHLDAEGYYTMSTRQDYPSLSQIKRKVVEKKVNLIFAVTKSQLPVYTTLSSVIEGAYTRELASDSSNIVDLVRQQYDEITSEVELKVNNAPENLKVSFSSECPGGKRGTNLCKGLKVGTTVSFNVTFELESCSHNAARWSHQLSIYPVGLSESISVQLEMLCECECEMPMHEEVNSSRCSTKGTYECGICNCYNNYYGKECECDNENVDRQDNLANCRTGNSSEICSGRGECVCGQCFCYPREKPEEIVEGQQCQCDNFSCDRDKSLKMCGGSERGVCSCGKCECNPGWSGKNCECATTNETCIGPNDVICSGNGNCVCGQCRCFQTEEGRYGGQFCEDCPGCAGKCTEYKPCVQCQVWQLGDYSEQQCTTCSFKALRVDELQKSENEKICVFVDNEGCSFKFTYSFTNDNKPVVRVLTKKECPEPANLLAISLGVAIGVVVVGFVILMAVRLCVYIKDRRECAKFEAELNNTKWKNEQNPLYRAAVSNYRNPTYGTSK